MLLSMSISFAQAQNGETNAYKLSQVERITDTYAKALATKRDGGHSCAKDTLMKDTQTALDYLHDIPATCHTRRLEIRVHGLLAGLLPDMGSRKLEGRTMMGLYKQYLSGADKDCDELKFSYAKTIGDFCTSNFLMRNGIAIGLSIDLDDESKSALSFLKTLKNPSAFSNLDSIKEKLVNY
jgi:hypothetical protein